MQKRGGTSYIRPLFQVELELYVVCSFTDITIQRFKKTIGPVRRKKSVQSFSGHSFFNETYQQEFEKYNALILFIQAWYVIF